MTSTYVQTLQLEAPNHSPLLEHIKKSFRTSVRVPIGPLPKVPRSVTAAPSGVGVLGAILARLVRASCLVPLDSGVLAAVVSLVISGEARDASGSVAVVGDSASEAGASVEEAFASTELALLEAALSATVSEIAPEVSSGEGISASADEAGCSGTSSEFVRSALR